MINENLMRIEIDTKHDSHDDIRRVVKILNHLVGDSQEMFTNQPTETASPIANIFADNAPASTSAVTEPQPVQQSTATNEDLFADLFTDSEIQKMDKIEDKEDHVFEDKKKKYSVELY